MRLDLINKKYLLNVQDLFPQSGIDLGIIKNRLVINFYKIIEWITSGGFKANWSINIDPLSSVMLVVVTFGADVAPVTVTG